MKNFQEIKFYYISILCKNELPLYFKINRFKKHIRAYFKCKVLALNISAFLELLCPNNNEISYMYTDDCKTIIMYIPIRT